MKKSIFLIGAAALALAMFVTGCSSTSNGFVKELQSVQREIQLFRAHDK